MDSALVQVNPLKQRQELKYFKNGMILVKAVILQPTYLPWIGYFGMIDAADIFVFYDDVQFVKKSWQQRNRIKIQGTAKWLTVPVTHNHRPKINEVKINNLKKWTKNWTYKHWRSIDYSYNKAPFFEDYNSEIKEIYDKQWQSLCDLDIYIIKELSRCLKIHEPKFIRSSAIEGIEGVKTDRVMNILKEIGADELLANPGARAYIEKDKFKDENIKLYWFEFKHPVYPQLGGEFIPFLSVIDLLFNTGKKSRNYIKLGLEGSLVES